MEKKPGSRVRNYLVGASIALLITACAPSPPTPDPCSQDIITEFAKREGEVSTRFSDALKLANALPSDQLKESIEELQALRRDATAIPVPDCALAVHNAQIRAYDAWIDVLLYRIDPQKTEDEIQARREAAWAAFYEFEAEQDALHRQVFGAPAEVKTQ